MTRLSGLWAAPLASRGPVLTGTSQVAAFTARDVGEASKDRSRPFRQQGTDPGPGDRALEGRLHAMNAER